MPQLVTAQLAGMIPSCCWQWNEALVLLDELVAADLVQQYVTNPVASAVLQLNERAAKVYSKRHVGSKNALGILDFLKMYHISPDSVTCTLVLSSLQNEWKLALELYHIMVQGGLPEWSLPRPNVYIYSAVMAVCARNQQYKQVWKLLEDLDRDAFVEPNTLGIQYGNASYRQDDAKTHHFFANKVGDG